MKSEKKYALISVSDKQGVTMFAQGLVRHGFEIISTGGTAKHLQAGGLAVHDSEEFTGIGSVLEDRVKTLCPELHGGLLAVDRMQDEFDELGYPFIDVLCVNLYPLEQKIAEGASPEIVIENTDVGGIALLHGSPKGNRVIASEPEDYVHILAWLDAGCPRDAEFRTMMGRKAEAIAGGYCITSALYKQQRAPAPQNSWEQAIYEGGSRALQKAFWSDPLRVRMG